LTETATARCNYLTAIKITDASQARVAAQTELVARLQRELYDATVTLDALEANHLLVLAQEEDCRKAAHVTYKVTA
jgi:hypothetical protein